MSNEALSGAQERRTQARLAAQLMFISWVQAFANWLSDRLPEWEAQLHRTNALYTEILNEADNAVINRISGMQGRLQMDVVDVRDRLGRIEGQVAELAATIATVVSRNGADE